MTSEHADPLRDAVGNYLDPVLDTTLEAAGVIAGVEADGGVATVRLALGFPADRYRAELAAALEPRVTAVEGIDRLALEIDWSVAAGPVQPQLSPRTDIRNIVAVASGKGGVGKSTTTVNLALALAAEGASVGILDADIYGPSQPLMLGLSGRRPTSPDGKRMNALEAHGVKCISIGFLIDPSEPMVWRGPMVTQALAQLLADVDWGELDYLVVDMPPGTGDTQLTLAQRVPVAGAVIVTTPQDIALLDARKGLRMFEKVQVPVLGIVENMSIHVCSSCGHQEPIFGEGGGASMAEQYGVPLLGQLPLDIAIRRQTDGGTPTVVADPGGPAAGAYRQIARRMAAGLARRTGGGDAFPRITIEDD